MKDYQGPQGTEPTQESNDNEALRSHLRSVYSKSPLTKTVRAFLLEDNKANALVASEFLKGYGFTEVVWRRSLDDAKDDIADLIEGAYDIAILDIMLPDGTSVGLLDQIKQAGCACPVGVYTGRSDLEDQAFYDQHKCDFVFAKPLDAQTFVNTLDALKAAGEA